MVQHYSKYLGFIIPATILVTTFSAVALIGWIYHIEIFTTLLPGHASMKFNTAISLIILSLSVIFAVRYSNKLISLSHLFSISAFCLGMLSLSQHLINLNFDINRIFFEHDDEPSHFHVFLMSPQSGLCISLMAFAMLWVNAEKQTCRIVSQYLFHVVTLIAFIVLIGYAYDVPNLKHFKMVSSMPLFTAILFFFLSVAASMINPALGITGIFTGKMIGNFMARRLFFSLLAGILLAGYFGILTHRHQLVTDEFGIALLTVSFCIITLIFIWIVSILLNKAYLKLQVAKENLNMVVEAAPYALVITDQTGNIIEVNSKTRRVFGYGPDELKGKNVSMLVPENSREEWMSKRNSFFAASSTQHSGFGDEIVALKKNSSTFPIEIVLTTIITDEGPRILSFVTDISTRKANEAIIQKQLIELQSKNQELEQFNYISSHDLQEPLRTVLNYIRLLEEDYPELSDEVRTHLKSMESSVTRMSTVVKSLLEFGRLGRNRKLALTDCKTIVSEVLCDLHNTIKESGAIIIIGDGHPQIYAYQTELRQLFQNLISNAIKFRKKDVVPRIEISCRKISGYYEFAVSDNGIGIAAKDFDRIFDIFQRLNKDTEFEGHGIGLANCRKIAEMHGGKIWVESEEGKGSTFKFTILNFKP